ncbi:MAG: LCCL domain-containing protein [Lachnospiraceae bacterium]|nr:LCCL domain-containing protein [Lachnospiraceae bacterium]
MCFHCGNPLTEPIKKEKSSASKGIIVVVLAVVLICGGTAAAHFSGLVTLPFLTEKAEENLLSTDTAPDSAEIASVVSPTPSVPGQDDIVDTLDSPSAEVDNYPPINYALVPLGYSNLTTDAYWSPPWTDSNGRETLGHIDISASLTGEGISDIADVWIGPFVLEKVWTYEMISDIADNIIPDLKQTIGTIDYQRGPVIATSYPIWRDETGRSGELLLFAFNQNMEALGHVLIPLTVPDISDEFPEILNPGDEFWWGGVSHLRGNDYYTYTINITGTTDGTVWGTDIYTDDSSVQSAAVHAGIVAVDESRAVTIRILPDQEYYEGTTRNGVTSSEYGSWYGSFEFINMY